MTTVPRDRIGTQPGPTPGSVPPPPRTTPEPGAQTTPDKGFPGLLRDLRDEAMTLVQQEMQLAKAELNEKIDRAGKVLSASLWGVGILVAGLVTLTIAATAALYAGLRVAEVGPYIAGWVAPLAVGLLVTGIGYAMMSRAKKLTNPDHWRPERTERSVRETKHWAERKF